MRKIFILSITILILLSFYNKTDASSVFLKPSKENISIGEQFYVDMMIDTEGDSLNGIKSNIVFDKNILKLIRIEDSKSMITLWVDKPTLYQEGNIKFSGIMTNGFSGVIDPFNLDKKLPGLILRFVFEPISSGESSILASNIFTTLNDGNGTIANVEDKSLAVNILDFTNKLSLPVKQSTPNIEFEIVKEKDLYDDKYVIIFNATDDGSGIKEVLIKEGFRKWKAVESPYLLKDQSRSSLISLRAVNLDGEFTELVIEPEHNNYKKIIIISLALFVIIFFIIKKYVYHKA